VANSTIDNGYEVVAMMFGFVIRGGECPYGLFAERVVATKRARVHAIIHPEVVAIGLSKDNLGSRFFATFASASSPHPSSQIT